MITPQQHQEKALHNERLLEMRELTDGEFVDWAVTVLFYGALHWMRALAAQEGHQIKSYRSHSREILGEEEVFTYTKIFTQQAFHWYSNLKDESRDARYEMRQYSTADFHNLRDSFFKPFKAFVQSKLHP